ncbi:hypothetical protein [Vreelandella titanicae]|uniref:hypothetical protein n=1 Tax=Vreelandella titanicae TaxID=664683 RepID=UPI00382CDF86
MPKESGFLVNGKSSGQEEKVGRDTEKSYVKPSSNNHIGTITQQIGTGQNAQNSFVWLVIKYSFWSAVSILIILTIHNFFIYKEPDSIMDNSKAIWDIFTPLITLALGYAFGKKE